MYDYSSLFLPIPATWLSISMEQREIFFFQWEEAWSNSLSKQRECSADLSLRLEWKSCLFAHLPLPWNLGVTLTPFAVQIPTTPHYYSFLFQVDICISSHLHLHKLFPTCVLRKDRFYANPMIRWRQYLGWISEVDSTVAADCNCEADVTCEWWILNEVVIGFINLSERASSKLTNFNFTAIYAYSLQYEVLRKHSSELEVPHMLPEHRAIA